MDLNLGWNGNVRRRTYTRKRENVVERKAVVAVKVMPEPECKGDVPICLFYITPNGELMVRGWKGYTKISPQRVCMGHKRYAIKMVDNEKDLM